MFVLFSSAEKGNVSQEIQLLSSLKHPSIVQYKVYQGCIISQVTVQYKVYQSCASQHCTVQGISRLCIPVLYSTRYIKAVHPSIVQYKVYQAVHPSIVQYKVYQGCASQYCTVQDISRLCIPAFYSTRYIKAVDPTIVQYKVYQSCIIS